MRGLVDHGAWVWPVVLREGDVELRPLRRSDAQVWRAVATHPGYAVVTGDFVTSKAGSVDEMDRQGHYQLVPRRMEAEGPSMDARGRPARTNAKALFHGSGRPDAVVLIDYPGFNWHIARAAKEAGLPVLYYVPPQVWSWGT